MHNTQHKTPRRTITSDEETLSTPSASFGKVRDREDQSARSEGAESAVYGRKGLRMQGWGFVAPVFVSHVLDVRHMAGEKFNPPSPPSSLDK